MNPQYDHDYEPGSYDVCRRCGGEKHGPAGTPMPIIDEATERAKLEERHQQILADEAARKTRISE